MEEWKDIPGFDKYQASNEGRIRSFKRGAVAKILATTSANGYRYVGLFIDGKQRVITVHSLIALSFLGERPVCPDGKKYEVHHKDGDRGNNALENLEYVTKSENVTHSYKRNPYWKRYLSRYTSPEARQRNFEFYSKREEKYNNGR